MHFTFSNDSVAERIDMIENLISSECYFKKIREHEHVVCFGAGSKARQTLPLLRANGIKPSVFCDNNSDLWGSDFESGLKIIPPSDLRKYYQDYCIVITAASGSAFTIRQDLLGHGETCDVYHIANPFKVEDAFLTWETITNNFDEFKHTESLFADNESQELFTVFLEWKMTGNIFPLYDRFAHPKQDSFFDPSLIYSSADHIYIDVGSYTGDTIMQFLLFSGGHYKQIIGFDPYANNCAAARDFVRYSRMENIEIRERGLWSKHEKRILYTIGGCNGEDYGNPNFYCHISHMADHQTRQRLSVVGERLEEKVIHTLDEELDGIVPTILKINALAADQEVLKGGRETISRHRPIIVMEYGCKMDYILETPKLLLSLCQNYKLYLRQIWVFDDCKTVLYAIPS